MAPFPPSTSLPGWILARGASIKRALSRAIRLHDDRPRHQGTFGTLCKIRSTIPVLSTLDALVIFLVKRNATTVHFAFVVAIYSHSVGATVVHIVVANN